MSAVYTHLVVNVILDAGVHVALGASELGLVLDPEVDHKVEVMPHVVFCLNVLLERDHLVLKPRPLHAWMQWSKRQRSVISECAGD